MLWYLCKHWILLTKILFFFFSSPPVICQGLIRNLAKKQTQNICKLCCFSPNTPRTDAARLPLPLFVQRVFYSCPPICSLSEMSTPQHVLLLSEKTTTPLGILHLFLLFCGLISDVGGQVCVSQLLRDPWAWSFLLPGFGL